MAFKLTTKTFWTPSPFDAASSPPALSSPDTASLASETTLRPVATMSNLPVLLSSFPSPSTDSPLRAATALSPVSTNDRALPALPFASPPFPTPPAPSLELVTKTFCTSPDLPPNDPRATLSKPLAILNELSSPLSATNPPPTAAIAVTTPGALSDSEVMPLVTLVSPCATVSVTGRRASPTLRMASSIDWAISAHFCDDASRRSLRFLSRMPVASRESFLSWLYSALFCI